MTHSLIQKLRDRAPTVISVCLDGKQILRIENGHRVLDSLIDLSRQYRLLTIHCDDDPDPIFAATFDGIEIPCG